MPTLEVPDRERQSFWVKVVKGERERL